MPEPRQKTQAQPAKVVMIPLDQKEIEARAGRAFDAAISRVQKLVAKPPEAVLRDEKERLEKLLEGQFRKGGSNGRGLNVKSALLDLNKQLNGNSYLYRCASYTKDTSWVALKWDPNPETRKMDFTATFGPIPSIGEYPELLEKLKDQFVENAKLLSDHKNRPVGKPMAPVQIKVTGMPEEVIKTFSGQLAFQLNPRLSAPAPGKPAVAIKPGPAQQTNELYLAITFKYNPIQSTVTITYSSTLPIYTRREYEDSMNFSRRRGG
ncbi:MAG: hypothetical protein V1827_06230 [Candidatus Micrarchaeota archaeon]